MCQWITVKLILLLYSQEILHNITNLDLKVLHNSNMQLTNSYNNWLMCIEREIDKNETVVCLYTKRQYVSLICYISKPIIIYNRN